MTLETAPFHNDIAVGPVDVSAYWLTTGDGIRIRVAVWGGNLEAPKGCVLMFPGRTEYIEKYGRTAQDFIERGYAFVAIDWRGQGLADRLLPEKSLGHVNNFKEYQHDVRAVRDVLPQIGIKEMPLYMIAHSMGGCIGLRSVMEDLPVKAATFTAPMWGIAMGHPKRTAAWVISSAARSLGFDKNIAPFTSPVTYVLAQPFEDNMLTTDPEMFDYMRHQVRMQPELALGGPSLAWLNEGLRECRTLRARPTPNLPCLTFLGTNERIVDTGAIKDRMARWPSGRLHMVQGAEHEVLMETTGIRQTTVDQIATFFSENA